MAASSTGHKELVTAKTLSGFQDMLPEEMIARNDVIDKIRRVYENYGFVPIDTPILEYLTTLIGTGGEDTNKQLFRLMSPEHEAIAMRFDLTVPFARLLAQHREKLKLPFRRYHIGPVFRADKPSPGRFRQFTQFDIDAAGSESMAVDAEIIAAMCDVMKEIGFRNLSINGDVVPQFQIKVNNRKLMDALLVGCGISDEEAHKHVLRAIDKLQKVGIENVRLELGPGRIDESGDPIPGVGLPEQVIDRIVAFISLKQGSRMEVIELLGEQLQKSELKDRALQEVNELAAAMESLKVQEIDAVFDPSLTRGLDYYTGPVFEAVLVGAPEIGSVMGGGRYDDLVQRFLDLHIPATGVSIGVDRLMAGLRRLEVSRTPATTVQVLVLSMAGTPVTELLRVASALRSQRIATEVYLGMESAGVRSQLSFANLRGIPVAVILGEEELKDGTVSVKDLRLGLERRSGIRDREQYRRAGREGQVTVQRGLLVETVKGVLGTTGP
jgi:histidyl-tRNA synthetase